MMKRVKAVDEDKIITETMQDSADTIADLNAQQMLSGIKQNGAEITPQYAPLTIEIKKLKGQPTDRVTLRDTGAFYHGIHVNVNGEVLQIDSTDSKTAKIEAKYGKNVFGLSEKFHAEAMREKVRPVFKQKIEDAIKLKMK